VKGQVSGAITSGSSIQGVAKLIIQIGGEEKKIVHPTNFKLLQQKKRNSINHNFFFKAHNLCCWGGGGGGGHCGYSSQALKVLAAPMFMYHNIL